MSGFLGELKRRNVIRIGGLYLVAAWLLVQVAGTLLPVFEAPTWVMKVLVAVLAIGCVLALALAWVFELTPQGLQRDAGAPATESIAPQTARRLDRTIIVVLLLALGVFAIDKMGSDSFSGSGETSRAKAGHPENDADPIPAVPAKSIAVLAFADMSPGRDNEYLGDGIAEEILNALAKVEELKVAGRTSSFSYKGKDADLREIGEALGVAHVLEGSVRRQGDQVRITAQLIRTADGFHLWSETFPGTMDDVFALQENIARAIAGKLQLTLTGKQAQRLVNAGTANTEAYALYLQASATFNRRDSARYVEAMAQLDQATTLDPGFARAYARLAALYAVALNADTVEFDAAVAAVEKFALRAAQLDPSLAEPHAVLGLVFRYQRKHRESDAAFARALALEPDDVTANFWWAITQTQAGYRRQGIIALDRTLQLDPLLPNALLWRGREHVADGELELAERLLRRAAEGGHSFVGIAQWGLERQRGNRDAGIASLAAGLKYFSTAFPAGATDVFARACLGDAEARTEALALIDAHLATRPPYVSGVAPYVLAHVGEPARALALLQDRSTTNDGLLMGELFSPPLTEARRTPEFPEFLRRMGLAAYWDEAGPPDQCKKDTSGDYHCE
ncbi:hypothetical protein [Dokdonella sp.]|uniref:hypothetical protein n=1 Tax=Dokdonella sp. TaxID=2291710 RepID=UPI002C8899B3|nr:hypothetical protein [Dokdonella sp.]HOX71838.1 hypothetical protein [Dokdonella sp.]HPN78319.1 hypothetical protein [Dokdonella sp.]